MENPIIKIKVKDYGEMTAELYPDMAPRTVENFLGLVGQGFYTGKVFHRVIKGFMIQGGGFTAEYEQIKVPAIKGEFASNGFKQNTLKHTRGVFSMARTNDPDSASSQFFIMHQDAPHLDGQYAGFGRLTDGFDVLDAIASCDTGLLDWYMSDCPVKPVEIESIEVVRPE